MRNKFADTIYDVSLKNDKVCVLAADISPVVLQNRKISKTIY